MMVCYEFITICHAVLRYNQRHEYETNGISLERIANATATAGQSLFQCETKSFLATAINTAMKRRCQATVQAVMNSSQPVSSPCAITRGMDTASHQSFWVTCYPNLFGSPAITVAMMNQQRKAVRPPHWKTTNLR
jgi:hypothetical protein